MTTDDQADPLERHERASLTVWGEMFSAQAREDGGLAFLVKASAPRDAEGVAILPAGDVAKLAALLDEMVRRGRLHRVDVTPMSSADPVYLYGAELPTRVATPIEDTEGLAAREGSTPKGPFVAHAALAVCPRCGRAINVTSGHVCRG